MTDTEYPPTLDQILKCSAPTQKLKKKNGNQKSESEKSRKCAHSHTYTWCNAGRPAAKSKKEQDGK